jgi:hypothetical protein
MHNWQFVCRFSASVAELADAQGLGPCVLMDVEVRLLSLALSSCAVTARPDSIL